MNEACVQQRPCVDTTWAWTGGERCNGTFVEREYKSNCDTIEWRIDRNMAWTDTGKYRCGDTNTEKEQINDCGKTRWVQSEPVQWTDTGATRCSATHVQVEQRNQCGKTRWVDGVAATWTDTGVTRCEQHRVQREQRNQCGHLRWTTMQETCGYCADVALPGGGYAYAPSSILKDPQATTAVTTVGGEIIGYIYPNAAYNNGATVPVRSGVENCVGCPPVVTLGYAASIPCPGVGGCDNSTACEACD